MNRFTLDGVKALAEALRLNTTVTAVDLGGVVFPRRISGVGCRKSNGKAFPWHRWAAFCSVVPAKPSEGDVVCFTA